MMKRAYSIFELKSFDEDSRTFEGVATTPTADRMGDIVEPKGAQFKLPLPLLWQHGRGSMKDPVGWVQKAKVTEEEITVQGQFAKLSEPVTLREDLDRVWALVKSGLVRGLSIGFSPIESADIKGTWSQRFIKWEWLELSAVSIPANVDASITQIKSLDDAVLGRDRRVVRLYPEKDDSPLRSTVPAEHRIKGIVYL